MGHVVTQTFSIVGGPLLAGREQARHPPARVDRPTNMIFLPDLDPGPHELGFVMARPFASLVSRRIHPVTNALFVGPYADDSRLADLRDAGITHLVNVGGSPGVAQIGSGPLDFRGVAWHPLADHGRLHEANLFAALEAVHEALIEPDARVYVHCVAGQMRGPTVAWLYLVACGISPDQARRLVRAHHPNAQPGPSHMVDEGLLAAVRILGNARFLPHPRPEALDAFPDET
jgi:hypothetical protein